MTTPYDLLGVLPNASAEEIKKAYRSAAKSAHPDTGGSESAFAKLNNAYDILKDPDKRAAFDRGYMNLDANFNEAAAEQAYRQQPEQETSSAFHDIFRDFFAHRSGFNSSAEDQAQRAKRAAEHARRMKEREEALEEQAREKLKQQLDTMKSRLSGMMETSEKLSGTIHQDRLDIFDSGVLEKSAAIIAKTRRDGEDIARIMNDAAATVSDILSKKPKSYEETANERHEAEHRVRLKLHASLQNPESAPSRYNAIAEKLIDTLRYDMGYDTVVRLIEAGDGQNLKSQAESILEKNKPGVMGMLSGAGAKHKEKTISILGLIDNLAGLEKDIGPIKKEIKESGHTDFALACRMYVDKAPAKPVPHRIPPVEISLRQLREALGFKNGAPPSSVRLENISLAETEILTEFLNGYLVGYSRPYEASKIIAALSANNRDKIMDHLQQRISDTDAFADLFTREKNKAGTQYSSAIQNAQKALDQGMKDIDLLLSRLEAGEKSQDIAKEKERLSYLESNTADTLRSIRKGARNDALEAFRPFEAVYTTYRDDPVKLMRQALASAKETNARLAADTPAYSRNATLNL